MALPLRSSVDHQKGTRYLYRTTTQNPTGGRATAQVATDSELPTFLRMGLLNWLAKRKSD